MSTTFTGHKIFLSSIWVASTTSDTLFSHSKNSNKIKYKKTDGYTLIKKWSEKYNKWVNTSMTKNYISFQ